MGRLSGPTFLLVPRGHVTTSTTSTVRVVVPCGEGSGGCGGGDGGGSAIDGGVQTRGLVSIGGLVRIGGLVVVGEVTIGVGVEALGGGHLGRRALDHLWLASMWSVSVVLLAVAKGQLPPHW